MTQEEFIQPLKERFEDFVKLNDESTDYKTIAEIEEFRKQECAKICIDYMLLITPILLCESDSIKEWTTTMKANENYFKIREFLTDTKSKI